ncbi:hypothetical protein PR202_gb02767 [Eleusine coracana subsp. coracana]|uniref:Cation/H+ exchanger transmembrane domain-containing protein n=1 Tax=Eleusine coracana subsp. coracana TaxID=191504 RepID=A0AAV5DXL8_ELECO|nr:hypothetical protein PR202_gb02767 [Eleusine coracana subsp. coracana]
MAPATAVAHSGAGVGSAMEEEQQAAGVGILLQISMLVLAFVLGHLLRRRRLYYIPEAGASLLIGLIVGGFANISNAQKSTSLAPKPFFSNFGAIVTFAIVGTFMATIITGLLVYLAGLIYLVYRLPLVECMMFGALVSATDPVTVLSIFQMAVSLYRTMSSLRANASAQKFFVVILRFLETFFGSTSTGVGVEKYMVAEGFGLSGIISILFTGIVMKRYTFSNLSEDSQHFTSAFFHLFSSLAETFVAANVFSCAYLLNLVRPPHWKIPKKYQLALWFSGLRGAMAFALALQSVHDLPDSHGQTILTATISIVVLSVLLIGGSTSTMLEALHVVGDSGDNHRPLEEQHSFDGNDFGDLRLNDEEGSTTASRFKLKLRDIQRSFD